MSLLDIRGWIRSGAASGQQGMIEANERKELFTAQGLPPYTEMTRKGDGWTIQTATLFAPLVAIPTTVAALEVYNNNSDLSLIIDSLFASQVLGTAATQTYAIYACVSTKKTIPTNTALDLFSLSGRPKVTTVAGGTIVAGIGTTVVANGWRPWGAVQAWGTAAATPGNSWEAAVNGRMIVPPGSALLIHIAGSLATASTFQAGATFYVEKLAMVA